MRGCTDSGSQLHLSHNAMQAGPLLLSVYLQTPTQSIMIGQSSDSLPLPAAITVLPHAVDPQISLIALDDSNLVAGRNATASVTLAYAFGNAVLPQDAAFPTVVSGVATSVDEKIPAYTYSEPGSGTYKVTVRLYAAAAYTLQVGFHMNLFVMTHPRVNKK